MEDIPGAKAPSGEGKEKQKDFLDRAIETALAYIYEKYEAPNVTYPDKLDFHVTRHSRDIVRRVLLILSSLRLADPSLVSEDDIENGQLLAAWHDSDQDYTLQEVEDSPFVKIKRNRKPQNEGDQTNEEKSAERLIAYNNEQRAQGQVVTISEDEVRAGMIVTKPFFNGQTVIQPEVTEATDIIPRVLALADIGGAGMDSSEQLFWEGDAVFREDGVDITLAVTSGEVLSLEREEYFKKRMLEWSRFQIPFAVGRQDLFEKEIGPLPENAKEVLRTLFNRFGENIRAVEDRAEQRERMSFQELVASFGYRTLLHE
jgi:hypothetical protein